MLREGLQGQDAARPVRVHTSLIPSSDSLPTDARFDASVGAPTRSVARDTVLDPPRPSPRCERTASEAPGAFGPHPDDNEGAPALQALADSFASLLTYGKADKKRVQEMVKVLLNLKDRPKPDDAADGLAIAICQIHAGHFQSAAEG